MARRLRGIAPDGTKYVVHFDREWREWQVRAYRKNKAGVWKFAEGPTYYANDREDATQTFYHLVGHGPAGTHVNPGGYIIKAQGYEPGPAFATKGEAIRAVQSFVREDIRFCRRKFGSAFVDRRGTNFWEVRPLRYSVSGAPIWSRYTISKL